MNIERVQELVEKNGIVFLTYGGFLSQSLIAGMTEALEKEARENDLHLSTATNIFTIFIELSQNMMNYSKSIDETDLNIKPEGLIIVSKDKEDNYYVDSQNVISLDDKEKIEPKLLDIKELDLDGIKKRYKELRRSGKNTHEKGGGIGLYEIAKRCNNLEYEFKQINSTRFYFHIRTTITAKSNH